MPPRQCGQGDAEPPAVVDPSGLSWLLRRALRRYRAPTAASLRGAGFGDLPQQGTWVIAALSVPDRVLSARDLVTILDVSKQAVGQLVDGLVDAGYVARRPDLADGRRSLLELTPRGRGAAAVIATATARVEADLASVLGTDGLADLHALLRRLDDWPFDR